MKHKEKKTMPTVKDDPTSGGGKTPPDKIPPAEPPSPKTPPDKIPPAERPAPKE